VEAEDRKYCLRTGELKLSFSEKFTHYSIVGFLLLIPSLIIIFYLIFCLEEKPISNISGGILLGAISGLLGLLFYFIQKRKLKFTIIETRLERKQIQKIFKEVAKKLNWRISDLHEEEMIAITSPSFMSGSWGERITILLDDGKILVNSICDPSKQSSAVSMGRNKKNADTLILAIRQAEPQKEF
jgi:hypothetical protein